MEGCGKHKSPSQIGTLGSLIDNTKGIRPCSKLREKIAGSTLSLLVEPPAIQ